MTTTTAALLAAPRFLMCPPDFYGVEYVINPWMRGRLGTVDPVRAQVQWDDLHALLTRTLGATVEILLPQPRLPDMVFTANAGLVGRAGTVVAPSCFRNDERRGEEPHFGAWFARNGFEVRPLPPDLAFEGAGDALFHEGGAAAAEKRLLLWAAHGFRTDERAHPFLGQIFDADVVSLHLTDPRFYHLDTCFCPLPGGHLLWYPPAFDADSRAQVEEIVPAPFRIAVRDEDACGFACNAVAVGRSVVLNACSGALASSLRARGFEPHVTPLGEFLKAGGGAKCLTLRVA